MAEHRLSSIRIVLKKAVYRRVCGFFSLRLTYLRTEIINTIHAAKAIINDNASYTLMLITSLPRGKPNTSNYLMHYSLANLYLDCKVPRKVL